MTRVLLSIVLLIPSVALSQEGNQAEKPSGAVHPAWPGDPPLDGDATGHTKDTSISVDGMDDLFEEDASPLPVIADETKFRMELASGDVIDVEKVFRKPWEALSAELRRRQRGKTSSLIRITAPESDQPLLTISRRGKLLDGPFASFEDGRLVAAVGYRQGQRDSVLMTWDKASRPIVFAQYSKGRLDGLRCLFSSCCEDCKSGHLWLVQEWQAGKLRKTHFVAKGGDVVTLDARYDPPPNLNPETREAMDNLAEFEKRLNDDEDNLKRFVAKRYIQERQAIVMRSHAASQANIAMLRNSYPRLPILSGAAGVTLTGFA